MLSVVITWEWREYAIRLLTRAEDLHRMFAEACELYSRQWEAARLVAEDEDGKEWLLKNWEFCRRKPTASDLGVSFEAQLAELS